MENSQKLAAIKDWLGTGSINLFGRQFAGKDTHGQELVSLFNGVLLGGGDIMRNSVIPQHVKDAINAGNLAPTEEYIKIVTPYLSDEKFKGGPLILSAVGRWQGEEKGVIEALEASGHPLKAVIYLEIDESVSYDRWAHSTHASERNHREDETRESLERRLSEFQEKTIPVIDYYRNANILITIDGTLEKSVVFQKIIDRLYAFATR